MRTNIKGFIAKVLVLCMVLAMLPTVALTAAAAGDGYYSINADATTGGTVEVYYQVGSDTIISHKLDSTYYDIKGDVTKIEVKITPDSGNSLSSASYQIGDNSAVNFTVSPSGGTYAIPASAFSGVTMSATTPAKIHITATFTSNSSYVPSAPSGGTTSGSTPDATVEVSASATTTGTTTSASVTERTLDRAVTQALDAAKTTKENPRIEVNVTTPATANGIKVTLPSAPLEDLGAVSGASLAIISNVAEITLNSTAIASIADQADGANVVISVLPAADLSDAQKTAAGDAPVYDLSITVNDKAISTFNGGTLTVTLPHKLTADQSAADVVVFYLADDGKLEACPTRYAGGKVTFTTTHLSEYVIGKMSMAKITFTDVPAGAYYEDAVKWAQVNGIANGKTATTFVPDDTCTRAEIVTFLWRYAGSPEPTATTSQFTDVDTSAYYGKAVLWAAEKKIANGKTATTFAPNDTCTRAEAVTFLYRYAETPTVSGSASTFTDVASSAYYGNAVAWAVAEKITNGKTPTTFAPTDNCTRAQVVTFLYRHYCGLAK